MIVDHGIGLQHVRADLAAPFNLLLFGFATVPFRFLDVPLHTVYAAAQHLHGALAVLKLAALFRALRGYTHGLPVGKRTGPDQTDTRVQLVDILAAAAAAAEGLQLDVSCPEIHFNGVVDLGIDEYAGERCVPAPVGIEW